MTPEELTVAALGACQYDSPLDLGTKPGDARADFVPDALRVLDQVVFSAGRPPDAALAFERAGPRQKIFFPPRRASAAIVTCGGLCPGLNNVVRALFYELQANYGVPRVLGVRYGYEGLNPAVGLPPIQRTSDFVADIHRIGGTVLGTSRGFHDAGVMVEYLRREGIDMLFCVGGDGTQRGAHQLAEEIARRELPIAVVGVPKTIDNDVPFVWRSFGFYTALEKAAEVIVGAHNEARSVRGGVGLVKLMGRHAGFIAARATLASGEVNFCLIPEVPFALEGRDGLLQRLERRLAARGHAVIVVAEGAGQDLLADLPAGRDLSGNRLLGDIGLFLKERIKRHFAERKIPVGVKYFDPSYAIRSVPANADDRLFSLQLASCAVHAAMAGKTDVLIGFRHNQFIHVPLPLVIRDSKTVDPESDLWSNVLGSTNQERW
jgi:6-phosphofructokinase 1